MSRKGIVWILAVAVMLAGIPGYCASDIILTVNGKTVTMDSPPVVVSGRTLVPLRAVFESLGVTPVWEERTRTVTASSGSVQLELTVDSKTAQVNGRTVTLDVPAEIRNGRVLVPARFIAETFSATVTWEASTRTVAIITGQKPALETGPFVGMQAPDFTLKALSGQELQLSELKGSTVALIFFTSW